MVNIFLGWNVALMLVFSFVLSLGCYNFVGSHYSSYQYLFAGSPGHKTQAMQVFGSFYLLNNSFIPLDIAVGLELVKLLYVYFIENDTQMLIIDVQQKRPVGVVVKNFSLHEDLAQIDFIFCDKTGTLTQNELIFKAFKVTTRDEDEESDEDGSSSGSKSSSGSSEVKQGEKSG